MHVVFFQILSHSGSFIDTKNIFLNLRFRICKRDHARAAYAHLTAGAELYPSCYPLLTVFNELEVDYNHSLIDSTNQSYPLQSYLNVLLHTTQAQKSTHLKFGAGWAADLAGKLQPDDEYGVLNPGAEFRKRLIAKSNRVALRGKLQCDIFQCEKPLVDGVDIGIRLWPASPKEFLLTSKADLQESVIVWEHASLDVPRITPKTMPRIGRALYPFLKNKMLRFSLLQDAPVFGPQVLVNGYLPRRVIIAFQNLADGYGKWERNRLAFEGGLLKSLVLRVNGYEVPRKDAFQNMRFADTEGEEDYTLVAPYMNLYEQLQQVDDESNCRLSMEEFRKGYTLFPIDLTQDPFAGYEEAMAPRRAGIMDLYLEFHTREAGDKQDLACFVFLQYEHTLIVHPNRECQIDDHSAVAHPTTSR